MAGINLFYIINRTVKGSKILYIKFVGHDGEVLTTTSATSLAHKLGYPKTEKITRKKEATRVASIALERGIIKINRTDHPFIEFVKDYWNYDGKRVQRKNRLKPNSIGRNHCYTMTNAFTKYAIPYLPKDADLTEITGKDIQRVLHKLRCRSHQGRRDRIQRHGMPGHRPADLRIRHAMQLIVERHREEERVGVHIGAWIPKQNGLRCIPNHFPRAIIQAAVRMDRKASERPPQVHHADPERAVLQRAVGRERHEVSPGEWT